jgi:hypothetical protein
MSSLCRRKSKLSSLQVCRYERLLFWDVRHTCGRLRLGREGREAQREQRSQLDQGFCNPGLPGS